MTIDKSKVAIEPKSFDAYERAVADAGCQVARLDDSVGALIWTDYANPQALAATLEANPQLEFVQLPFAGVDAFKDILKLPVRFASAKGSYREPVAEHALMLAMALGRILPERVRATSWGRKFAVSLYDAEVTIVGGGGITEELIKLLKPFRAKITVVRNRQIDLAGAKVVTLNHLDESLATAQFVILACALTAETHDLFDAHRLAKMQPSAYLVNISRGAVVNTEDLVAALANNTIAGAALDVTNPEPLPDNHPLFGLQNCIITPHTADTNAQVIRLFSIRIRENLAAYQGKGDWVGLVDKALGY
jgi:phosphoglycerate dehydrogenase-like enzyme